MWKIHTTTIPVILSCNLKPCTIFWWRTRWFLWHFCGFLSTLWHLWLWRLWDFCGWRSLAVVQCNGLHGVVIKEQIMQFCVECGNCGSASAGFPFMQFIIFVWLLQILPFPVTLLPRKILPQFLCYFFPNGHLCLWSAFQETAIFLH